MKNPSIHIIPELQCQKKCANLNFVSLFIRPAPYGLGLLFGTDKICQRSVPVWLMSVLQIRRTIPYNARKAVAKVRKIQAGKGVTKREDMEKAFPPVLSNLNLVVVAGNSPVEKCRARGQQAAASGAFTSVLDFIK